MGLPVDTDRLLFKEFEYALKYALAIFFSSTFLVELETGAFNCFALPPPDALFIEIDPELFLALFLEPLDDFFFEDNLLLVPDIIFA